VNFNAGVTFLFAGVPCLLQLRLFAGLELQNAPVVIYFWPFMVYSFLVQQHLYEHHYLLKMLEVFLRGYCFGEKDSYYCPL